MTSGVSPGDGRTLLVVDDDQAFRTRIVKAFRDRGLIVSDAATYDDACARARDESPELALVDLQLAGRSGIELVNALKTRDPTTRIVVLTGYGSIATAVESLKLGATSYLTKPADADQVLAAFDGASPDPSHGVPQTPSLARVEWEHIQRVLLDSGHNLSEAARRLGIHRRSLQRKLAKDPGPEQAGVRILS